jgi:hypothetical protein
MKVVTENFSKLINAKSGDVKPLVNEQTKDGVTYSVQKTPQGKFRIFAQNASYKTPTDASQVFGGGSMWKDYNSEQEARTAINSIPSAQKNNQPKMNRVKSSPITNSQPPKFFESDLTKLVKPLVNEQGEEEFLDKESKDRIIKNIVHGEPYKSTRVASSSECEGLIQTMKFIFKDYMDSIETLPDEYDEVDALGFYDGFETELGGILDHANQMDCDDKIIQHLEILYNEYLSDMANKLGLR